MAFTSDTLNSTNRSGSGQIDAGISTPVWDEPRKISPLRGLSGFAAITRVSLSRPFRSRTVTESGTVALRLKGLIVESLSPPFGPSAAAALAEAMTIWHAATVASRKSLTESRPGLLLIFTPVFMFAFAARILTQEPAGALANIQTAPAATICSPL